VRHEPQQTHQCEKCWGSLNACPNIRGVLLGDTVNKSVTFDSNVWENVVDENKRNISIIYTKLYELIRNGVITPYFFEGLATIETIKRKDRKKYYSNYNGQYSISITEENTSYKENTSYLAQRSPEISDYLNNMVPKALELGFRFIKLPRVQAPQINLPEKYWALDTIYSIEERQKRSMECARFIESLGCGKGKIMNNLASNDGGLVQRIKNDTLLTNKKFATAMSEWSDGDALAASYGYGISFFCTNDRASTAGTSSIFHPTNLKKLESIYPVNIITPEQLINLVAA
jgi:hypothetical protein